MKDAIRHLATNQSFWWHGQRLYKTIAPPPTIFKESRKKKKRLHSFAK
jgi:hypothetical protein